MADDSRETDQQKIDSAINELAERKNGKRAPQIFNRRTILYLVHSTKKN